MQSLRPELPSDNVQAYVPIDRRRALAAGQEMPVDVEGAALFADISGFTLLTEALVTELGPQRGAEELTFVLDFVVESLLGVLEQYGGTAIYFSGDAITCWLDGDDGVGAVACGFAMQKAMETAGHQWTPGGTEVRLHLKAAVAVGEARRFVVGDPEIQLIDVLAGALMDALAAAEQQAKPGEVIVDDGGRRSIGDRVTWGDERPGGYVAVSLKEPSAPPEPLPPPPSLPDDVVQQWLLPAVYQRLSAGHGEFLSELRPAIPLFLRFTGIDVDDGADAQSALGDFIRAAQQVVDANGGNVMQLTVGDKGAYLYAVFGAPVAHEDDAVRACTSALQLLELERSTAARGLQVGLAAGRLRSGTYGHRERRTFCCLGDAVNLAARLMTAAPAGSAYVSAEVRRLTGAAFTWDDLPRMQVKGRIGGVQASALVRSHSRQSRSNNDRQALPMVGREDELRELSELARSALAGAGRVVVLTGEAGVGKTRLVTALTEQLVAAGVTLSAGTAPAFGVRSSYAAWQDALRSLWNIAPDASPESVAQLLEPYLAAADPGLVPRLPLLGELVGIPLADNALTATFDAKLRKTSLESLVVQYLESSNQPLVLVFEDTHWLDPLSMELLEAVARAVWRLPLFVMLVQRPPREGQELGMLALPHVQELKVGELDATAARRHAIALGRARTDRADDLPDALVALLVARAQGNPFHLEELLSHLLDRGLDPGSAQALDVLLPDSLHSLILTRIDDLTEGPRRTLKVASVVGRRFGSQVLSGAYPDLGGEEHVDGVLLQLLRTALLTEEPEHAYAFRHALTEEVAYESLPFAIRSRLHDRVGDWLEEHDPAGPGRILDLLAHHFGRGTDNVKKQRYLVAAGISAQDRYANDDAVDYYRQALPIVDDEARAPLLQRLGAVLERRGGWAEAELTYTLALDVYRAAGDDLGQARVKTDLAEVARKRGRFGDAAELLTSARAAFDELADTAGIGRVLHLEGTLASQQGRYPEARSAYEASLRYREALSDMAGSGALLSNLAVVAECVGDYDGARLLGERALAVRQEIGDPAGICVSQNNLGMIALLQQDFFGARDRVTESMRLAAEIGDPWMTAVGHHNLGNAYLGLGQSDEAGVHFTAALIAYEDHADRWSLALLVEDVALLALRTDQSAMAIELTGAADALRDELAAPRAPAAALALAGALVPAHASVGALGETHYDAGRTYDLATLSAAVKGVCGRA